MAERVVSIRQIDLTTPAMQAARALCHGTSNYEYVRGAAELLIDTHAWGSMNGQLKEELMTWLVSGTVPTRPASEILADFDRGCRGEADIDMREILWEIIEDIQNTYRLAIDAVTTERTLRRIERDVNDYLANNYGDD